MHRQTLLTQLNNYLKSRFMLPEEQDSVKRLIQFVTDSPECFEREHVGHVTGSVWLINHDRTKALLTHHKKLNLWLQLGGHADGDPDISSVALKEAHEESGIADLTLVMEEIYDIDIHAIPNKCTYHYDVRFLIQAPQGAQYLISEESHDLAWVPVSQIADYTSSRSVLRMAEKMGLL